ncbi:MAG: hypothetical protein K6G69_02445 [Lachnospiraceae bacterium]|nr:hypothetical protein [Lachnospiraceae bacterium]
MKQTKKWKIYIVCHKKIHDETIKCDKGFNNDNYVFLNVGNLKKIENADNYNVINQSELENSISIGKIWAESEGLYNVWRSGIYKELDYVGCIHYDVQLQLDKEKVFTILGKNNITKRIERYIKHRKRGHISFATFYPKVDYDMRVMMDPLYPNIVVGDGRNCYYSIIEDYNAYFGTKHTVEEFKKYRKFNLCSCFLIDTEGFNRMMSFFDWLYNSHKLDGYNTDQANRFQGAMAERYFGVFLLFEYKHMKNLSLIHLYDAGWK